MTFWSLSMYDLYTPSDRYDEEVAKLKKSIGEIDDNKEFVSCDCHVMLYYVVFFT